MMRFAFYFITFAVSTFSFAAEEMPGSFAKFETFIKSKSLNSVDSVVGALPDEFTRNFTMMEKSASQQSASWKAPRVITYNPTASLTLAYSNDPLDPHYNALETIEFIEGEDRMVLREIKFTSEGMKISKPNPKTCLGCHGADPTFIWESYDQWTGAVRGNDDGEGSREDEKKFNELLATVKNNKSRLSTIPGLVESYQLHLFDNSANEGKKLRRSSDNHNFSTTLRFFAQNSKRIARIIRTGEGYTRFKYLIFGALFECGDIIDTKLFYPENFKSQVERLSANSITEIPTTQNTWKSWATTDFNVSPKTFDDGLFNTGVGSLEQVMYHLANKDEALGSMIQFREEDVESLYSKQYPNFRIGYDLPKLHMPKIEAASYVRGGTEEEQKETKQFCMKLADASRNALSTKNEASPKPQPKNH